MANLKNSSHSPKAMEYKPFDYESLDSETRSFLKQKTSEMKEIYARTLQDAWEAGQLLLKVKERLEHGQFCRWVANELGLSRSTACNQMRLAQSFKCATVAQMNLPISTCYELARSSTPPSARDEVIERSQAGEKITTTITRQIIASHKPLATEQSNSNSRKLGKETTSQTVPSEMNPSEVTINVDYADITDRYPDNVIHFRSKNHNRSTASSGTFHALCLFTSLNSLSLEIMKFAKDGRKSC